MDKNLRFTTKNLMLLISLLVFAFLLRVIYSDMHMVGGDHPGHILASMRLHFSSLFDFSDLNGNFFAQIMQFNHGYSVIVLPFILYEIFFNFFGITISESSLIYVHSIIGVMSLFSIYLFLYYQYGEKIALYSLLILAVIPIHIGLSRTHVGYQMIQSIFFLLSLTFLSMYISKSANKKYLWFYFIATFFYIGSDNAFIIGLFIHLIFIFIMYYDISMKEKIFIYKKVYFNWLTILFVILPIISYIIVTFYLIKLGIPSGYLLRLFSKTDFGTTLGFFIISKRILLFIGPIFILFLISLFSIKKIFRDKLILFLFLWFMIYFLIFSIKPNAVEDNYVFLLVVPMVAIPLLIFKEKIYFNYLVYLFFILTLIYSFSVVYGLNIGQDTIENYGSVNKYEIKNNDVGLKTLGYLSRTNQLNYSKIKINKYGYEVDKIGLYVDHESSIYYLGNFFETNLSEIKKFENYYVVYSYFPYSPLNNQNEDIENFVEENNLSIYGHIVNGNSTLMTLYTNKKMSMQVNNFDVEEYNKKFDDEFGSMDKLGSITLGHH